MAHTRDYPLLGKAGHSLDSLNRFYDELAYRKEHDGQPLTLKDLSADVLLGFIAECAREAAASLSAQYPAKQSATEGTALPLEVNKHG